MCFLVSSWTGGLKLFTLFRVFVRVHPPRTFPDSLTDRGSVSEQYFDPDSLPCLQLRNSSLQWPIAYFLSSRTPAPRVAPPPSPPQLNSVRVSPVSPYRLILLAAFALGVGWGGDRGWGGRKRRFPRVTHVALLQWFPNWAARTPRGVFWVGSRRSQVRCVGSMGGWTTMKRKKFVNHGAGLQKVPSVRLLSKSVSVSQRECAGKVSSHRDEWCDDLKEPLARSFVLKPARGAAFARVL